TKDSPDPPGGIIERNKSGHPTGLLVAKPNAMILYATLAKGPKLPPEHQINSTRHFMRELNRLGVTSCIDAGGGFQNYPDDYQVVDGLHRRNELTVRIAYNLFTQKPTEEKLDFARWMKMTAPGAGSDYYRTNGAGEMLVFSAADFEDFLEARPDLPGGMESELKEVIMLLAKNKWPFRLHATYDESINRFLNVLEEVHREVPLDGLSWFFDHAETITDRNIERVMMLGGGIAVQHRMAFQGEYFVSRYGAMAAEHTPPIRRMLEMGVPVGAGTDATRVASYNPFACLYWLVSGKTCGGLTLYPEHNRLTRDEALLLYTVGSAGFSSESDKKGSLAVGQFADLAVLSADYFSIPVIEIKALESVLTIVGGKPVYATHEFQPLDPPALPVLPEWSPVAKFGGYGAPMMNNRWADETHQVRSHAANCHLHAEHHGKSGLGGCMCWAF
ncbi:MAG: amidohydrolase, partial [Gallionella sp.]